MEMANIYIHILHTMYNLFKWNFSVSISLSLFLSLSYGKNGPLHIEELFKEEEGKIFPIWAVENFARLNRIVADCLSKRSNYSIFLLFNTRYNHFFPPLIWLYLKIMQHRQHIDTPPAVFGSLEIKSFLTLVWNMLNLGKIACKWWKKKLLNSWWRKANKSRTQKKVSFKREWVQTKVDFF
jgi:hypothetical protein